jgi:uncharacterized coiled-coil DUF342 family protein
LTEQKTIELEAINQQINALREKLNKTHEDMPKHIEKRDKLNEQTKLLRQEIGALKKERDQLNENVKTLKLKRDEARAKITPFIEEIKTHSLKIRELKEKRTGASRQELQKEFDALEFKIATTSLDLHEEKRLIDQVKKIEIALSSYKKMDTQSKKISEIKNELKVFQDEADKFHKEVTESAKRSQDLHAKMLAKFDEMKKIREEATGLHVMFLQAREQIKPINQQIGLLMLQRGQLFEQRKQQYEQRKQQYEQRKQQYEQNRAQFETAREAEARLKKAKENEIKEKLGSEVRDKLQRGEKLNWQEFQLLAGDDSETEDT